MRIVTGAAAPYSPASAETVVRALRIERGSSPYGATYWRRLLNCPREHLLANVLGKAPQLDSPSVAIGLAWHHGLEAFYRALRHVQDPQLAVAQPDGPHWSHWISLAAPAFAQAVAPLELEAPEVHAALQRMWPAYLELLRREPLLVYDVERELSTSFRDVAGQEHTFSARVDLLVFEVRDYGLLARIVEHKTSARSDFFSVEGYQRDPQVLGQQWLFMRCLVEEIETAASKFGAQTSPAFVGTHIHAITHTGRPTFEIFPVAFNEAAVEAFVESMRYHVALLELHRASNWPPNYAHCVRRYGKCSFFAVCQNFPDLDEETARRVL